MPSKSRTIAESRKTEEIIQAYGHEVTPETLALFNGVLPERVIQTPSHDTGAIATRLELKALDAKTGEALVASPIEGLAPADYNKSRDSKPGGLNTVPTKHEESVAEALEQAEPADPEAPIDAGTFISPEIIPSVSPQGVPYASPEEAAARRKAAEEARQRAEAEKTKTQAQAQSQAQAKK